MSKPELDVRYIANLARIRLTDEEAATFQSQLGQVLDYVEQLDALDIDGVEPTAHANPVFNVLRKDMEQESLPQEKTLSNAPRSANGLFMVPKVIE